MNRDDGNAAFPLPASENNREWYGMSLRDYFAGQFMSGRAAVPGTVDHQWDAAQAYEAADAMLAERLK